MTTATMTTQSKRIDTGVHSPDYFKDKYWEAVKEINRLRSKLQELNNAMAKTDTARREQESALALYGESEDIKALTARLEYMLPNAQEIGTKGVALVAQIAAAHGLDPLPGSDHVYAYKQGQNLVVLIGYKGLLHLARQQVFFTHQSRAMTEDERNERKLRADQIGYVTEVWEIEKAKACHDSGIPYFPIRGEAVWSAQEDKRKKDGSTYTVYSDPPQGRDGAWVCRKNSLKDALRQITSTGVRLGKALDAMFAEMGREMALEAGISAQATGEGWSIQLPDTVEDDPEAVKQELIDAGVIQPDTETIDGEYAEAESDTTQADPATCSNCGIDDATGDPDSPYPAMCTTCANKTANIAANEKEA